MWQLECKRDAARTLEITPLTEDRESVQTLGQGSFPVLWGFRRQWSLGRNAQCSRVPGLETEGFREVHELAASGDKKGRSTGCKFQRTPAGGALLQVPALWGRVPREEECRRGRWRGVEQKRAPGAGCRGAGDRPRLLLSALIV